MPPFFDRDETARFVGQYRVSKGDLLRLRVLSSVNPFMETYVRVLYDSGGEDVIPIPRFSAAGTYTIETFDADRVAMENGWVVGGLVEIALPTGTAPVKRGQVYGVLSIGNGPRRTIIAKGYVTDTAPLPVGEFTDSLSGRGWLSWQIVAQNVAPVDVTRLLRISNARATYYGFVWYFNAAVVAVTRTMDVEFRANGLAAPTGMGATVIWTDGTVTLTSGEEGIIYVRKEGGGDGYDVRSDAGVVMTLSTATNPLPFPVTVEENDLAELFFNVGGAEATDRHSIYVLVEEHLVI